jgi:general nucleoside transport system permease protein
MTENSDEDSEESPEAGPEESPVESVAAEPVEDVPPAGGPSGLRKALDTIRTANTFTVTTLAIFLALVVGAVMMVVSDQTVLDEYGYFFQDPTDALRSSWDLIASGYTAMFQGAVFNPHAAGLRPLETTIVYATPLVFAGLAVAVPFRSGMFNIGGQGQLLAGAVCASYVGFAWALPTAVHVPLVLIAGMIGGALYASIAGILKARTGAHEVITTIMFNYIGLYAMLWLISTTVFKDPKQQILIGKGALPTGQLPHLPGTSPQVTLAAPLALVAAAAVWWLFSRSTLGFRLRAAGSNPDAARTAGINVARTQVWSMVIAGALMGLVGVSQVMGTLTASHALTQDIDAGLGFTGITVALLGRGKAWGVVLAALLFGALNAGGVNMEAQVNIPQDIDTVIQALIVIFVAAPALVREVFRLKEAGKVGGVAPAAAVITVGES